MSNPFGWWWTRIRIRRLTAAQVDSRRWKRSALSVLRDLARHEKRIAKAVEKFQALSDSAAEAVQRAIKSIEQHDHVEDRLNSDIETMKITLEGMALSNELGRQRTRADVASEVRREVIHVPNDEGKRG